MLGVGVTAGYLQWKAPDLAEIVASRRGAIAAAPTSPEGRLHAWLDYGNAFMHNRLSQMRLSAEQPWLVTHAIGGDGALEIHGIDLTHMPTRLAEPDGLTVHVRVPAPKHLGTGALTGEHAPFVPVYARGADAPDPVARTKELVSWALAGVEKALERDIPGASLTVEVDPRTVWLAASGEAK